MFKIKKNKTFSYKGRNTKEDNQSNIQFDRKVKKSKSRLSIYLIMLILILGLLFYFKNYN